MSRKQEIRDQQHKDLVRNRILVIILVSVGALLVVAAIVVPMINIARNPAKTTDSIAAVTPITPKTFDVRVDGQHLGETSAPVKIDVWEDFQCPACRSYSLTVEPQIIANYVNTGKVYYTYHFYPLVDGGNATGESHQSANAALCASEQERFWDYHDILFANWNGENQGSFSDARLAAFAESLGLDMTLFNQCLQGNKYANFISQDMLTGQTAGVQGTPSVFVNGQLITPGYVPTYDQVAAAIDSVLAGK